MIFERMRNHIAYTTLAVVALTSCAIPEHSQSTETGPTVSVTGLEFLPVEEVVDGDTVELDTDKNPETKAESVRMIGMDTPEVVDPRKPVQCFGEEASKQAKKLLEGKSVALKSDETQDTRDKYRRLLGYIILEDGRIFNYVMIEEGFAYEYTYETPYKYQKEFRAAEKSAEQAGRGLWSPKTCNGERKVAGKTAAPTPADNKCVIKGNINDEKEKIYHLPDGRYYEQTQINESEGEKYFCTEEDAKAAGWRKAAA